MFPPGAASVSDFALRAESLGKRYRLIPRQRYHALRDTIEQVVRAPLKLLRRAAAPGPDWIWALRDVSFEVSPGSVVGIVGRNGSGKTTLLRVLSRITRPTSGRAEIRGRVGSLLDVGTGFHPELTGRENVFLSGAILGMHRAEIKAKLDEIVAFSGVESFIDQPLKHFSSGMQFRLAFAVAAHLEPKVLFVDEVLAVGDLAFQKKCLGKMDEVSRGGRTILLVSHQMNQIRRLCQQTIWLEAGEIRQMGPTAEVVPAYERELLSGADAPAAAGVRDIEFLGWDLLDDSGPAGNVLTTPGPVTFAVRAIVRKPVERGEYGIGLYGHDRSPVWSMLREGLRFEPGVYRFVHRLPSLPLRPGVYWWQPGLFDGHGWSVWRAQPELVIDTPLEAYHRLDEYIGLLNIPATIDVARSDLPG